MANACTTTDTRSKITSDGRGSSLTSTGAYSFLNASKQYTIKPAPAIEKKAPTYTKEQLNARAMARRLKFTADHLQRQEKVRRLMDEHDVVDEMENLRVSSAQGKMPTLQIVDPQLEAWWASTLTPSMTLNLSKSVA